MTNVIGDTAFFAVNTNVWHIDLRLNIVPAVIATVAIFMNNRGTTINYTLNTAGRGNFGMQITNENTFVTEADAIAAREKRLQTMRGVPHE